MPKTSSFNFLKFEAGMFNGTGGKASDFDFQKDFISRLSIAKSSKSEKFKYGVGVSYYDGGVRQANKYIYKTIDSIPNNIGKYGFVVDSATTNTGKIAQRQYMGIDAQISFDFPFGITTLKGEYIQGVQPGSSSSTKSPSAALSDASAYTHTADTYLRSFNGAYFYFIQNIMQTKHQIVIKYDWYDPNTKVSGDQIAASGSKLGTADLKFSTLGIGYNYKWDNNIKISFYYDMVTNETSKNLTSTMRFQYKF
ncbi:MAG: hypothetical protein NTX97_02905 [Bacteroidetes bacterium]|nr:hypothetical protein [Bacteroidota bacterium]